MALPFIPGMVQPFQEHLHVMAPSVRRLLSILAQIAPQMDIALPIPCPEVVERGLMVIGQDAGVPAQDGKTGKRIQVLLSATAVEHASFSAEVSDICLFSIPTVAASVQISGAFRRSFSMVLHASLHLLLKSLQKW